MNQNKQRDYSLDVIKIVATTIIIFHHYQQGSGAVFKYINFWNGKFYCGYLVELFFILSGLFSMSYIKKGGEKRIALSDFIYKKAVRLIPLLSLSVLVEALICVYQIYLGAEKELNLWQIIVNALGLQSGWVTQTASINGPTWYISVLMFCYIVFYAGACLSLRWKISHRYFYILIIFTGIAINTYGWSFPFLNSSMARGYISFFTGALLSDLLNSQKECKRKLEFIALFIFLEIALLMILYYDFLNNGLSYILVFFFYPSVIILFESDVIRKICNHKIFGILSAISFDTYIWHEPLAAFRNLLMMKFSWAPDIKKLSSMILFTLIAWIVGAISYFCLEKPISNYFSKPDIRDCNVAGKMQERKF